MLSAVRAIPKEHRRETLGAFAIQRMDFVAAMSSNLAEGDWRERHERHEKHQR